MAPALMRGLARPGCHFRRQLLAHVSRPGRCHAESSTAGLISRQRTATYRCRHSQATIASEEVSKEPEWENVIDSFDFPPQSPVEAFTQGRTVTVHGFISKRRDFNKKKTFVDLHVDSDQSFQFEASWEDNESPERDLHRALRSVPPWSPVALTGEIQRVWPPQEVDDGSITLPDNYARYELKLSDLYLLNPFPKDVIISEGANFPPKLRHLQLRFDKILQDRLKLRSELTAKADAYLRSARFTHVETPVLFKSTPEGAREFLVPTRRPGFAYALPQSPQQYKQLLMASGVRNYFQFARCFRDEDLRADRQPEFTQLDLEMSFATGKEVMALVEGLVRDLYAFIELNWRTREVEGQLVPTPMHPDHEADPETVGEAFDHTVRTYPSITPSSKSQTGKSTPFPRITYDEAMLQYGSDKPDLRIPNKIQRIEHLLSPEFTSKISKLENPIVEACVFRFKDTDISDTKSFFVSTWDKLPKPLWHNPDGQPSAFLIDSSKPLSGLSSLGHEAGAAVLDKLTLDDGDLLVIQARANAPFAGGATALGTLRKHIYDKAVAKKLLPFDNAFHFLWVTCFPLFTPLDPSSDPGQGGAAGFAATHHPFTAPLTPADFALLATDPLAAKADHYDLVVNGVELGGGSRRIHVAAVQEHVFRRVLRMSEAGIAHFGHLLEALRAGCPPHAGFAFGWDRVCATLGYTDSVRDVIAFPKSKRGEEPVARVPGEVGAEEWAVYGLREVEKKK